MAFKYIFCELLPLHMESAQYGCMQDENISLCCPHNIPCWPWQCHLQWIEVYSCDTASHMMDTTVEMLCTVKTSVPGLFVCALSEIHPSDTLHIQYTDDWCVHLPCTLYIDMLSAWYLQCFLDWQCMTCSVFYLLGTVSDGICSFWITEMEEVNTIYTYTGLVRLTVPLVLGPIGQILKIQRMSEVVYSFVFLQNSAIRQLVWMALIWLHACICIYSVHMYMYSGTLV